MNLDGKLSAVKQTQVKKKQNRETPIKGTFVKYFQ